VFQVGANAFGRVSICPLADAIWPEYPTVSHLHTLVRYATGDMTDRRAQIWSNEVERDLFTVA
jgi:hypothetical protein